MLTAALHLDGNHFLKGQRNERKTNTVEEKGGQPVDIYLEKSPKTIATDRKR